MYRRRSRRAYNNLFAGRSQLVGKRNKYSTLTYANFNPEDIAAGAGQVFNIVPQTTVQGKRKVKNISVSLSVAGADTLIYWAIVFVPSGTTPGSLVLDGSSEFYTPSAFVMANGIYDSNQPGNGSRLFTPLSRNLNSGDSIALIFTTSTAIGPGEFRVCGNYAITLN